MSASAPIAAAAEHAASASRAAAAGIQAKLSAGRSHDAYEQEADRVAAAVVDRSTMPAAWAGATAPGVQRRPAARAAPTISRLRDRQALRQLRRQGEEKEEPQARIQRQEEEKEEPQARVQRQEEEKEEPQAREAAKVPEPGEPAPGEKPAVPEAAAPASEEKPEADAAEEAEGAAEEAEGEPPPKAEPGAKKAGEDKAAKAKGVVGALLRKMTESVFEAKKAGIAELAAGEKQKEPAETKLAQTEKAVVPPAAEGASRARADQVGTVAETPEPEPDEAQARERFNTTLEKAVPATLEAVDKFKKKGKGRAVGEAVQEVVSADVREVRGTYQEIDNPPPEPPAPVPEELPEIEAAPETPTIDPGEGVVGEVPPEHTDLSEFGKQSDALLEKEQLKEEHLELVDEGELAEAKNERHAVKSKVKEGPREIELFEQQEKEKVGKELREEEQAGRRQMRDQRQKELLGARGDQQKTRSKIEQKRQQVTLRINAIYEKANATVRQKLDGLEEKSLREFDEGEKKATTAFEGNVNQRLDAFKKRRYSGFWGGVRWAKDKLFGMDDLPEVKEIFDSEKTRFVALIDGLIKKITAENQRVIRECREIVANARQEIETYVQGLGPELRETGREALTEMQGKLDALDKNIDDKQQELQQKLAAKREAAIKAIEEKIEKMKEEMSGLVSKLGGLLLDAALKFFKWALKKAGFSGEKLMEILNKGKVVITKIVTDPVGFIKNIVKAVGDGIGLFQTNIKKHLVSGLFSWLTGAMADVPITLPAKFDLKGILYLVLQILGLTWDRIRQKLVNRLGEKVVGIAETSLDVLSRLITEGPIALWDMLKEKAAEIKDQVMESIRNWVVTQVVKQGIIKLLSFLNPAGAIIQAILAIYQAVMFFVENWQRILEFVRTVVNSIGDIAMGKVSKAAQAVERALAMTIPIILNFLARLLGLSGIGKAVSETITKIRKPIAKVVDQVIDRVAGMAEGLMQKGKAAAKGVKDKAVAALQWWRERKSFKDPSGKAHTLFFQGQGTAAQLMVATDAMPLTRLLQKLRPEVAKAENKNLQPQFNRVERLAGQIDALERKLETKTQPSERQKNYDELAKKLNDVVEALGPLLPLLQGEELPDAILPAFQSGVKGRSFEALYLSRKTPKGEEAGKNKGDTMPGWQELRRFVDPDTGKSIRERDNFVKMHLLHAQWGKASDSNLAPAMSGVNTRFYTQMESSAVADVTKKDKVLWYRVDIDFHGAAGPVPGLDYSAYPKKVDAAYGPMEAEGNTWTKKPARPASFKESIAVPDFRRSSEKVFDLNADGARMLRSIDAGRPAGEYDKLSEKFTRFIYNERRKESREEDKRKSTAQPFASYQDFVQRMEKRKERVPDPPGDFKAGMALLEEAHRKGKIVPG